MVSGSELGTAGYPRGVRIASSARAPRPRAVMHVFSVSLERLHERTVNDHMIAVRHYFAEICASAAAKSDITVPDR